MAGQSTVVLRSGGDAVALRGPRFVFSPWQCFAGAVGLALAHKFFPELAGAGELVVVQGTLRCQEVRGGRMQELGRRA